MTAMREYIVSRGETMAVARIEDGCAQLGAVTVSDDFRVLEIKVSDLLGYRSTVAVRLDAEVYEVEAAKTGIGQQQFAERVADTLRALIQRSWEVMEKRVRKGEPSL